MSILLLATFETKQEEAGYLMDRLVALGAPVERLDLSLGAEGAFWPAADKIAGMERAAERAIAEVRARPQVGRKVVLAMGGGTGGQIALRVLRALPLSLPKVLVSTLPFDPRYAMADDTIVMVPTISDLCGLNATVRQALDRAAAIAVGLWQADLPQFGVRAPGAVGVTTLGVTAPGTDALVARLRAAGREATVFHANGFGGAAFARWCEAGAFEAVVDYTPHELTRIVLAGVHADMPTRFTAAGNVPRVVLAGGVNFLGMGAPHLMPEPFRTRRQYRHSPLFTHVLLTEGEAGACARALAADLSRATAPVRVLLPMGGFSSEDRPGGAIEAPGLRAAFADALDDALPPAMRPERLPWHINDPRTAAAAADAVLSLSPAPPLRPTPQETA